MRQRQDASAQVASLGSTTETTPQTTAPVDTQDALLKYAACMRQNGVDMADLRSADRNGSVIVEAVITPAAAITGAGNGSAVKVTLTLQNNSGALIAPAEALVSRLDGSYAVEQQLADGSTKWLTVELLGISGGNVAISGTDLGEGTVLLLPA